MAQFSINNFAASRSPPIKFTLRFSYCACVLVMNFVNYAHSSSLISAVMNYIHTHARTNTRTTRYRTRCSVFIAQRRRNNVVKKRYFQGDDEFSIDGERN